MSETSGGNEGTGSGPKLENQVPRILEASLADAQALKSIDSLDEGLQSLPSGALGAVETREAAGSDVKRLSGIGAQKPQGRAAATDTNSIRSDGPNAKKRHAIPPLEDRFNVKRIGLIEKEYHFRDQAGKVAFTDKFRSLSADSESPAAIKAMVDRAAERGWATVWLSGSSEFMRLGWIAATAQGLKAVGHSPTAGDREAAAKERTRLQVSQELPAPQRRAEGIQRVQSAHVHRVAGEQNATEIAVERQLAAAIEKALVDGKVSPELRGQVRAMMATEGAKRLARGERFKVPVYDARAARARAKTVQAEPQRRGDRERSR